MNDLIIKSLLATCYWTVEYKWNFLDLQWIFNGDQRINFWVKFLKNIMSQCETCLFLNLYSTLKLSAKLSTELPFGRRFAISTLRNMFAKSPNPTPKFGLWRTSNVSWTSFKVEDSPPAHPLGNVWSFQNSATLNALCWFSANIRCYAERLCAFRSFCAHWTTRSWRSFMSRAWRSPSHKRLGRQFCIFFLLNLFWAKFFFLVI